MTDWTAYPGQTVAPASGDEVTRMSFADPPVPDVAAQFNALPAVGTRLPFLDAGLIPGEKYTSDQEGTDNVVGNHFQGIQRIPSTPYAILSMADWEDPLTDAASQLALVERQPAVAGGSWGAGAPDSGRVVGLLALERGPYWHAGGIALLGDLLAVPLECYEPDDRSRVVFLSMAQPLAPALLGPAIDRTGKGGSVALTRLANGHFVCGVWSDPENEQPGRLDLYLSQSARLEDGFPAGPAGASWLAPKLRLAPAENAEAYPAYQALRFVTQPDGQVYLIGTGNTQSAEPFLRGRNYAHLMKVEFGPETLAPAPVLATPTISIAAREFDCSSKFAGLGAAGGVFIDADGRLALYSAYHYRVDHRIRCTEFWPG